VNENEKTRVKAIKTEVYSRIVGYYRPVQDWHLGKQQEFKERAVLSNMDIERAVNQPDPKGE
jgi:anaerobic ribonucleoside-triphosphate reductase